MSLSKDSSERIELLRFPLIIGIVFIHVYDFQVNFSSGASAGYLPSDWVIFIMNTISQGLARVALPIFFLISGFFVFATHEQLLITLKKLVFKLTPPTSGFEFISIYLILPFITIAISLLSFSILKRLTPKFLMAISGGR